MVDFTWMAHGVELDICNVFRKGNVIECLIIWTVHSLILTHEVIIVTQSSYGINPIIATEPDGVRRPTRMMLICCVQ